MKPLYLLLLPLLLTHALCAQTTAKKLAEYMDAACKELKLTDSLLT